MDGGFLARSPCGQVSRCCSAGWGRVPVLGLPGNPVSALVCAILFLLPALARMSGPARRATADRAAACSATPWGRTTSALIICGPLSPDGPAGELVATPFPVQDSAMLRRLALADALILRAPHAPPLPEGAPRST